MKLPSLMNSQLVVPVSSRRAFLGSLLTAIPGGGTSAWSQAEEDAAWEKVRAGRVFRFPPDHGNHPDFRWECWDLRAHLFEGHRRFGLRAVWIRQGLHPGAVDSEEVFSSQHWHLAHVSVLDGERREFRQQHRLDREGWNARSASGDLRLHHGDWTLERQGGRVQAQLTIASGVRARLLLLPHKSQVMPGIEGVVPGLHPAMAASHHISFPRMDVEGQLVWDSQTHEIRGKASLDHHLFEAPPEDGAAFVLRAHLMLLDDHEFIVECAGEEGGDALRVAHRAYTISPDAQINELAVGEYEWTFTGAWPSPRTGANYPVVSRLTWRQDQGTRSQVWLLQPVMEDQEYQGAHPERACWSGSADVLDEASGELIGWAFLDLRNTPVTLIRPDDGM